MTLPMRNLIQRNGVYAVRVQLPADVQAAFGKTAEVRSLKTRNLNDAIEKAGPMVAAIKRQIEKARTGVEPAPQANPNPPAPWSPDAAFDAIQRWAKITIDKRYLDHFHGLAPTLSSFGDDAVALSERIHALQESRFADVVDFDASLVQAIAGQGLEITIAHPAIPHLRAWFGQAWGAVESHSARFRHGDFSGWSLEAMPERSGSLVVAVEPMDEGQRPRASTSLSEAMESFIAVERPDAKDEREIRGYVRRLIEHLGDIAISDLTTTQLDGFLVRLRKFPVVRKPAIIKLSFDEIVDRYGDDADLPKVAHKTIRTKWFGAYNRIAKFALSRKLIRENPVAAAMPRKRDDIDTPRDAWTKAQIGEMFAKPLFTGAAILTGNRDQPGKLVSKDAKFWLPLIGLWTGMRLDEIGALSTDELTSEGDLWYFDLTQRPLRGPRRVKNRQSQRIVPVHNKLIDLGLIVYARKQGEWLFPELPHEGEGPGDTTKQWSKWFGRWWRANGLLDETKNQDFHSLRHNFKAACREAGLAEDVHDRLTGHAGNANQQTSRTYGVADVAFLSESMNKVDHPAFKLR
jgi:integrase